MRLFFSIIFLSFFIAACSKKEEAPQLYSSHDYRMDGTRFVPDIGVMSTSSILMENPKDSNSNIQITAPPVPLPGGGSYMYVLARGNTILGGDETSLHIIASLPDTKPITLLLTDSAAIYAIHADGEIHTFDHSGKLLWQYQTSGFDEADPHSILTENALVIESDSAITSIDIHSGKNIWSYKTVFPPFNIIYDNRSKLIIAALSFDADSFLWGDTLYHHATDSIICFTPTGTIKSRFGFPNRIISNLCLCGKDNNLLAFGFLHQPGNGEMRSIHIEVFSGIETAALKKISDHELSYLPTQISSNGAMVFASGFYGTGSAIESGIEAFSADDTTKLWQRRFDYALYAPLAISNKYAYFSLSFSTQAEVPAKSIFYTLDISTGKTLGELPILGARSGFTNSIPMPLADKGIIVTDASRPVIYFLKP